MQSKAPTVAAYLASLPADRRATLEAVRKVVLKHKDPDKPARPFHCLNLSAAPRQIAKNAAY
jgi:hypothetical protein